jgi:hypothetical protein
MDRPRRRVVGAALAAAVAFLCAGARVRAQHTMTKREAEYQDHPKDIQMCSTCTLFVRPNACKVVAGDISPDGWCKLFDMAD